MPDAAEPAEAVDVAVVGAGPRGISTAERIVARHRSAHRPGTGPELRVLLIDPYRAGPGKVWHTEQPAELLMNTMSADNTVFPDPSVRLASPVGTGPTFLEWLRRIAAEGHRNAECVAFARASGERDYAPRRIYGEYLADALESIRSAPGPVRTAVSRDTVERIVPAGGGHLLRLASGGTVTARSVVLATGHLDAAPPVHGGHLTGRHPTDYGLDAVPAGAEVLLRGGGLNAYDVIALLTAGRGGRFTPAGYVPSGREPRLWITTRRGVPYHARVDTPGVRTPVAHLTPGAVDRLAARDRIDFRSDVLPLLRADLALAWRERGAAGPPDLEAVAAPLRGRGFADADALQEWFAGHLEADAAAATDPALPPAAALAVAIRQARPALTRIITAGNLTGESYRRDVLGHLNGFANFLSAGPPARRVRELRALLAAGVVRLLGPARPAPGGGWAATAVPGLTLVPDLVIDAWIPAVDVASAGPGIVRALLADGMGRPHTLPSATPGAPPLPTGALDVRAADGRVRCPGGGVHDALFAVGVPLEGVRWTTAIGARPGTDSAFFHETDQVAAEVLAHLAGVPEEILP
ncbi:FAD/NAD(P)-binding protein [Streptomyces johnsoniae]|uniref:FAD/NAD(P)-binding protein n=1 Tax=Streptomyces johnsoniae TaxID=3075532 RepID=A0ABU2S3E0_9ACTN|nr:FAD/NAD(P)-binding protein [Streptomyces sp. DSM 41886]MDT0442595.1 FAD/NAD(P)-binding protein [Streptomyces sp. DSM 41886]